MGNMLFTTRPVPRITPLLVFLIRSRNRDPVDDFDDTDIESDGTLLLLFLLVFVVRDKDDDPIWYGTVNELDRSGILLQPPPRDDADVII